MTVKRDTSSGLQLGIYIHRLHVEPRAKLHVIEKESFPFPQFFFDVTRTTHTSLGVGQEGRVDDYWNVDGD